MKVTIILPDSVKALSATVVWETNLFSTNVTVSAWGPDDLQDGAVVCPKGYAKEAES